MCDSSGRAAADMAEANDLLKRATFSMENFASAMDPVGVENGIINQILFLNVWE